MFGGWTAHDRSPLRLDHRCSYGPIVGNGQARPAAASSAQSPCQSHGPRPQNDDKSPWQQVARVPSCCYPHGDFPSSRLPFGSNRHRLTRDPRFRAIEFPRRLTQRITCIMRSERRRRNLIIVRHVENGSVEPYPLCGAFTSAPSGKLAIECLGCNADLRGNLSPASLWRQRTVIESNPGVDPLSHRLEG